MGGPADMGRWAKISPAPEASETQLGCGMCSIDNTDASDVHVGALGLHFIGTWRDELDHQTLGGGAENSTSCAISCSWLSQSTLRTSSITTFLVAGSRPGDRPWVRPFSS